MQLTDRELREQLIDQAGMCHLRACSDGKTQLLLALIDGIPDIGHPCFRASSIIIDGRLCDRSLPATTAHTTAVASMLVGAGTALGLCPQCQLLCIGVV